MNPGGSSKFSGSPFSAGTHPGLASRVGIAAFGRSSRRLGTGRRIGPNRLGDPVGSSVRCSSLHNPVPSIRSANREHVHRSSDSDVTRYRSSGRCSNEHNHILNNGLLHLSGSWLRKLEESPGAGLEPLGTCRNPSLVPAEFREPAFLAPHTGLIKKI